MQKKKKKKKKKKMQVGDKREENTFFKHARVCTHTHTHTHTHTDILAGKTTTTNVLRLGRYEMLRSLGHYPLSQSTSHH